MSATADAYDREEAAAPIAHSGIRCSDCGQIRPHAGDGRCQVCLDHRTVPVKAHVPRPRYMVTVRNLETGAVVFGPEPFVTEKAVDWCFTYYQDEEHAVTVDYINSKAGVLR